MFNNKFSANLPFRIKRFERNSFKHLVLEAIKAKIYTYIYTYI